jgi:hypothetical protein
MIENDFAELICAEHELDDSEVSESTFIEVAIQDLSNLEAMFEDVQAKQALQGMLKMRVDQLEAKEQATSAHNSQLLLQLTASTTKQKNTSRECNAMQQQNVELQQAVNDSDDKSAALRRELEEKNVELIREEKRRKKDVEDAVSSSRAEVQKALDKTHEETEHRIRALNEQHSKRETLLKSQYNEKMILFSSSASESSRTACTVSEAQLKQSLAEAKDEIRALQEQIKLKVYPITVSSILQTQCDTKAPQPI